ncbi:hypothetical protein, partial [Streptomyces scabiei]
MTARVSTRWVTGDCWLGCERTSLLVIWLGPVQWDGQHAPFMACEDCLNRIKAQALSALWLTGFRSRCAARVIIWTEVRVRSR